MLIINLYGNAITSSVTVKTPPSAYESIVDMLNDGYRILWNVKAWAPLTTKQVFDGAFALKGVDLDRVDKYFYFNNGSTAVAQIGPLMRNRIVTFQAHGYIKFFGPADEKWVNQNQTRKRKCRHVQEPHDGTRFFMWRMRTTNRDWLMETVERIHQSGLRDKISEWIDWSYNLLWETLEEMETSPNKPIIEADLIVRQKLEAPILFCGICIVMSVVAFAMERNCVYVQFSVIVKWACKYRKRSRNGLLRMLKYMFSRR